jgi:hypothetical protein
MIEADYLRRERECIAEYDGKLSRENAQRLAHYEQRQQTVNKGDEGNDVSEHAREADV